MLSSIDMRTLFRAQAILLAALCAATSAPAQKTERATSSTLNIPLERMTLANGLEVLLSPDHSTPQVAVDLFYHVGSSNEQAGRTGFAHIFEHVMFTGSAHVAYGVHDRLTQGVNGIANNGQTTTDFTEYYEIVPPNYLESMLWIESDRMGFLLDKFDSTKFVTQRDVVRNERRFRVDNQPYGRAFEIMITALYPESHPYSWPIIGYMGDLEHATVEDVKNFFRLYYAPSNAVMAIVGDFDPAAVKPLITKYFGDLPRGKPIVRPGTESAVLTAEKRLVFEDRVRIPQMYLQWPTVGQTHPDNEALTALASVLSASPSSRLDKVLVKEKEMATNVSAFNNSPIAPRTFNIVISPRTGHTLTELEAGVDSVIARLKKDGPTAEELQQVRATNEFGFVASLESYLGKAEILAGGFIASGNPEWYKTRYQRLKAVTAEDVKRVANKYLTPDRVVLSMVPTGGAAQAAKPEKSIVVTASADAGRYTFGGKP